MTETEKVENSGNESVVVPRELFTRMADLIANISGELWFPGNELMRKAGDIMADLDKAGL